MDISPWLANNYNTRVLSKISRSKGNQAFEFGEVTEYKNIKLLSKNHAENEAERLVPELFLFFEKALYEVKGNGLQLCYNHIR